MKTSLGHTRGHPSFGFETFAKGIASGANPENKKNVIDAIEAKTG